MSKKLPFSSLDLCRKISEKRLTKEEACLRITKVTTQQAQIAQLVEQRTENPCVVGSIPTLGILHLLLKGITTACSNSLCYNPFLG